MPDKTTFIWEYFGPNPFRERIEAKDEEDFKSQVVEAIGDRCASVIEYKASDEARETESFLRAAKKRIERSRALAEEQVRIVGTDPTPT
jgi:hypothetical protein